MFNKRGQVTVFIAIGVVLLILFGLIFYSFKEDSLSRGRLLVDDVDEDFNPVQVYVHSCLEETASRAIRILGEHGGWLIENEADAIRYGIIPSKDTPTGSNSFYFFPETRTLEVPYWFYADESLSGVSFGSMKPELISNLDEGYERQLADDKSVEAQIDRYVNANLAICIKNFDVFSEDFEVSSELPTATTFISDEDVIVNLNFPLEVDNQGKKKTFDNFGVVIPVKLKKTFELAEFITKTQIEHNYLENNLRNLIPLYSMPNSKKLAPTSDFTFIAGSIGETWSVVDLNTQMTSILASTSNMMRVQGAYNYDKILLSPGDPSYETRQKVYDNMVLPMEDIYYEELEDLTLETTFVSLKYLDWWPIHLSVNGGKSEVKPTLKGVSFGPLNFGLQEYETDYDVSWPVMVSLKEIDSFSGRGFIFNIGLEGNLRNNLPLNSSEFGDIIRSSDNAFPNFCGERNKGDDVIVNVNDILNEGVEKASISFISGKSTCILGTTNESGELNVTLPAGSLTGWVVAKKEGYLDEKIPYKQGGEEYSLNGMRRIKSVKFNILKKMYSNGGLEDAVSLEEGDQAIVTLRRFNEEIGEVDFTNTFVTNSSEFEGNFVEGNYDISINLFNLEEEVTIEDQTIGGQLIKGQTFSDGFITGGVELTYIEGDDLSINFGFVEDESEVKIYVIEHDISGGNFDNLGNVRNQTKEYYEELIPEVNGPLEIEG